VDIPRAGHTPTEDFGPPCAGHAHTAVVQLTRGEGGTQTLTKQRCCWLSHAGGKLVRMDPSQWKQELKVRAVIPALHPPTATTTTIHRPSDLRAGR
jgi:hypothetical protein